jgi:hypothetical protein
VALAEQEANSAMDKDAAAVSLDAVTFTTLPSTNCALRNWYSVLSDGESP